VLEPDPDKTNRLDRLCDGRQTVRANGSTDMSLINPAILWGFALVSIPVILHFLLRARPKKYLFPALRLIQARRTHNIRRLRLRHIWLLLLRMGVLALLVMAIARPTLPAANYHPSGGEWLRTLAIAAVVIGTYVWFTRSWKQQRLPQHLMSYRRALLRAAAGAAALLAFLLIVAVPYGRRISAEMSSPLPASAENLPVSAVFIFDSSLSMSYRYQNLTRLEAAQAIAVEHLGRLPTGSRVAVADTSSDLNLVFQAEQSGAVERIQKLAPRAVSLPLADRIRAALQLQEEDIKRTVAGQDSVPEDRRKDRYLREIYLFTDLTVGGWRAGDQQALKADLERLTSVQLYVIDVGIEKPTNAQIIGPRLSAQSVPKGTDLAIEASVDVVGFENQNDWTIELHVENESGTLVKREQRTLHPSPGKPAATSFVVGGLLRPITNGQLRLASSDPFVADDVRYFTIAVTRPIEVLVVGARHNETHFLEQALAPKELVELGKSRYKVTYRPATKLDSDFKGYDIVCLVNVDSPSLAVWSALGDFVNAGGGLFVVAGNERLTIASYNSGPAQAVLPARLTGNVALPHPVTLDLRDLNRPVLNKFQRFGLGELATAKIMHRWGCEVTKGAGRTLCAYTDPSSSPALVERALGSGRVILFTSALDRNGWNDLPLAGWPFVVLLDQIAQELSHQSESQYNYIAGDEVTLPLPADSSLSKYLVRRPGGEQLPGEVPPGSKSLVLHNVDQIGAYEVVSNRDEKVAFSSGFSANASPTESDFTRISGDELDKIVGKGRYSVARSIEGLTRNVTVGRVGQEVFSLILGLVLAVFCAEQLVANRFYEVEQP
jgi:Aerotolerance regulator N-terminal/von Willebrand factor type A domain